MSNAGPNGADTYLTCNVGATFKHDLTFQDVDVSTLTAMAFEVCAYPGGAVLLTVTPTAQSSAVARVVLSAAQTTILGAGCFYYYFRITTAAGEKAVPVESTLRLTP
jgi:hypothetical protein